MEKKRGVGYIMPFGEVTFDGWPIDPGVVIPDNWPSLPKAQLDKLMHAKFGPTWRRGKSGVSTYHSSDAAAAAREAWERAQRGIDATGILVNGGSGYDGNPTENEVMEIHRGVRTPIWEFALRVAPGSPGYGVEPFDTSNDPVAHARQQWSTEQWRTALTNPSGMYFKLPQEDKDLMLAQLDVIEAGAKPGWSKNKAGKWFPDPGAKAQAEVSAASGTGRIAARQELVDLLRRAAHLASSLA